MLLRIFISALALSAITSADAVAATVSPIAGEVSVSNGQGFQKIAGPVELHAGAQVMVGPQGAATIAYADDCVVPVKPAAVTVVSRWSPCGALPEPMHFTPRVGEEVKTSDTLPPTSPPRRSSRASSKKDDKSDNLGTYVIVGGVAVGAGVVAAVLASQGDDDPVSP